MRRDEQVKVGTSSWKAKVAGVLLGLIAATSASGQRQSPNSAPGADASQVRAVEVTGIERRISLPGGRYLTLSADGASVSLWSRGEDTSRRVSKLDRVRRSASLTLLPSGRVLVWGGANAQGELQQGGVWFDPQRNAVEAARDLTLSPRAGHTTTVLTDGRVLFAGGKSMGPNAELWEEHTNRATAVAGNAFERSGHHAELKSNGQVRLFGGTGKAIGARQEQLFDPATNSIFVAGRLAASVPPKAGLAGSLPTQGAQGVLPEERLSVRFTQPLRITDLHTANLTLLGPAGVAEIGVIPVEEGRLVFIQPKQALFPDSQYTLLIEGVHTTKGDEVPLITVDFKTAALSANAPDLPSSASASRQPTPSGQSASNQLATVKGCGQRAVAMQPCVEAATLQDGIWTPGRDNTDGRWRVAGSQPELLQTMIMSRVTEAVGFTTLIGQIRQVDGLPVANVEVSIGRNVGKTDANGHFTLYEVPAGRQEVYVDGTSANRPGVEYGQFVVGVDIAKGKLTQLPYTMYLPRIAERDKIRIDSPTKRDTVLKHPNMPGLKVQIPAGTVIRDRKGRIVRELAIVPTPVNRAPFPVADNYPMYFTLEPGGAVIQGLTPEAATGVKIFYPNYDKHQTGTQANFWLYDPAEGWRIYGKGRVTTDGKVFSPEAGVALHQTMGGSYSVDQRDPPPEDDKPECNEGCGSAQTGGGATAGDPIDLRTGRFYYDETDILISDIVPIKFGRSYRSRDVGKRQFGIATTHNYAYKLSSTSADGYNLMKLVLPNGTPIPFSRTSGSGLGGTWHQTGSLTSFNDAEISFISGQGFHLSFADGSEMMFDKYSPNSLLWMADRYGNRTEFAYDAGFLARITSPSGRYISLTYDTGNRVATARDSLGNTWSYTYHPDTGLLTRVTYPDLTFKQYEYKYNRLQAPPCGGVISQSTCDYFTAQFGFGSPLHSHGVKSITDRRGIKILENEFETNEVIPDYIGRVIKQTLPDGSFYTIDYEHLEASGGGYGTLVTNPDGSQRRITFATGSNYPRTDTVGYGTPLAQTVTFERDSASRITASIDARGRRTEYVHDGRGRTTQVTYLAGTADALSVAMGYAGDRLTSVTDPLDRVTRLEYQSDGCLSGVVNPLGKRVSFACNLAGQYTSVTDPLGRTSYLHYLFHDLGEVVDPLGRSVRYRYDALGRMIATEDDYGNVTRREYDAEGRVKKIFAAGGEVTEVEYNANGNVTAVLMPHGNGITYDYDDQDRLLTRTDSLGQAESWTYDVMDRVETYTDRKGQVTNFDYDALGRLETTTYQDGSTVVASYDNGDRLVSLADSVSGTLGWDYDDLDRVVEATSPQGTLLYDYDAVGRRTEMIAGSQAAVTYDYDDGDRLRKIQQGSEIVTFDYDNADRLLQSVLPNGIKAGYAYNDADQVTGIAWLRANDTPLGDLGYGYNEVGQRIAQTGSFASNALPTASTGNTFDDNNRQTAYKGATLSYDDNGNLTGDGTRTYVWNARDQLIEIKQGASTLASFSYDATGRRISRTEGGQTTAYLYDGLDAVQENVGTSVNPILTGLGIDERYARNDNGGRTYFLTDALGSTRALTNAAGNVVNRYDYTPYGQTTQTASGFSNPYQYTGREQDANGLMHYRARYYNAGMGRFISEDPLGLAAGDLNLYAYTLGNPIDYSDPSGKIVPLILGIWAGVELALTLYDLYDTAQTLLDPCISGGRKAAAAGLLLAGAVLPGGGYSKADDAVGIVYRRTDALGGKPYIGQAINEGRYAARQAEHNRANPNALFSYEVLGKATPGAQLNRMEEFYIRQGGGPTNLSNPNGGLANRRHQMNDTRYQNAGGDFW